MKTSKTNDFAILFRKLNSEDRATVAEVLRLISSSASEREDHPSPSFSAYYHAYCDACDVFLLKQDEPDLAQLREDAMAKMFVAVKTKLYNMDEHPEMPADVRMQDLDMLWFVNDVATDLNLDFDGDDQTNFHLARGIALGAWDELLNKMETETATKVSLAIRSLGLPDSDFGKMMAEQAPRIQRQMLGLV